MPQLSVIVPMRNEEAHIQKCLGSLLGQTLSKERYEVVVVDGESEDRSRKLVLDMAAASGRIRLLDNPSKSMPTGMNIGLREAEGDVIVVASAHAEFPPEYLETCLKCLDEVGADVVGGPLLAVASDESFGARMCAAVISSRFGVGNSAFRTSTTDGFVDTVPYGAYRRHVFDKCGLYDECLVRSQDYELNARIRRRGFRIYQSAKLTTYYHPVRTVPALCSKAFATAFWHLRRVLNNREAFAIRHFVPGIAVICGTVLMLAGLWTPVAFAAASVAASAYLVAGIALGRPQAKDCNFLVRAALPLVAAPFHFCYGLGTIAGAFAVIRKPAIASDRVITFKDHS